MREPRQTFDKSPVRESRTPGSVGEALSKQRLYPTTAPPPSDARRPARADVKRSQGLVSRKRESAVLYER
jgi:hypothetical protein